MARLRQAAYSIQRETMSRKPWFPFYVDDFWQDEAVQAMSLEEVGFYLRLLSLQWREGSIPSDLEKLGRICHLDGPAMARLWPSVSQCFTNVQDDLSRIINRRLAAIQDQQTAVHQKLSEQGKMGARARWGGDGPAIATPMPGHRPPDGIVESEVEVTTTTTPPLSPPGLENDTPASSKQTTKPAKRKSPTTPPPENFELTTAMQEWFREKFGNVPARLVKQQTEQFLDHHRSKGNQFVDWKAAWRTWMTNWRSNFGKDTPTKPPAGPKGQEQRDNPNLVKPDGIR